MNNNVQIRVVRLVAVGGSFDHLHGFCALHKRVAGTYRHPLDGIVAGFQFQFVPQQTRRCILHIHRGGQTVILCLHFKHVLIGERKGYLDKRLGVENDL